MLRQPPGDAAWASLIPTVDAFNRPRGMRTQWDVHTEGLWHTGVAVLIFDSRGRLLLQRRAPSRWTYPGAWDASVAETSEGDEEPLRAARRGVYEELGMALPEGGAGEPAMEFAATEPYCWRGRMPEFEMHDCEIDHFFVMRSRDASLDGLAEAAAGAGAQPGEAGGGEVAELRFESLEVLGAEVAAAPERFTPTLLAAWYGCGERCWGGRQHPLPEALVKEGPGWHWWLGRG